MKYKICNDGCVKHDGQVYHVGDVIDIDVTKYPNVKKYLCQQISEVTEPIKNVKSKFSKTK